jgi:ABC-type dipeptide/oligopeptide/nickel transport system permease subunit
MAVEARPLARAGAVVVVPPRVSRVLREIPLVPATILALLVLSAACADLLAPYDPTLPLAGAGINSPPFWMEGGSTRTPLGTDFQGRDELS